MLPIPASYWRMAREWFQSCHMTLPVIANLLMLPLPVVKAMYKARWKPERYIEPIL